MPFHALEFALAAIDQLATVEAKLRKRRKSLADQAARAADSVALNPTSPPWMRRSIACAPFCGASRAGEHPRAAAPNG